MKAEGDNLDTIKTTVRRLSLDIQNAICDEEDVIRNAIYEKLEAEISNDGDDCNDGPPPEISDFLKLTNDPLCLKIAQSFAKCGDKMLSVWEIGCRLSAIGDDINKNYVVEWSLAELRYYSRSANFTDLLDIALRLCYNDKTMWRLLVVLWYIFKIIAMRYLGVDSLCMSMNMLSMNMLLQYAEGLMWRIEMNRILYTRQRNRRNNNQRLPTKYVYIAVPVIAIAVTAFQYLLEM